MSATPVVLLHGWAMTPAIWRPLQAELARDCSVFAPALPGHHDAPAAAGATLTEWTDALSAALPDRATVVGWSLGAMLALDLAARHPHKVSSLVLIAANAKFVAADDWAHGLPAATVAAFQSGYATAPEATLRRFLALQTLGDPARRTLLPLLEAARQPHPGASPIPALADGLRILAESDLRPQLAAVTQPVTLVHGAGDALMPVAAAHWLADALPDAHLSVFDDCGHVPFLTRNKGSAELIRSRAGV
ncbi:MAG: alpha/beta fold hydrolase [Azoarcus sp.]|nr:alpha/beta fold hydrolase [Azoarcus sp.]